MRTLFILILLIIFLPSCRERTEVYRNIAGFAQGTTYSIVYGDYGNNGAEEVSERVEQILKDFDMSLSLYKDSSILSMINRNEDVRVDSFFVAVFRKSALITGLTGGAFDVTVGPLVRAWGFGPDSKHNFSTVKIDSLRKLVGMNKVRLSGGKLLKDDPGIKLDFNAIAQGYSVDVISAFLETRGIKNYLVEIGGEVMARGTKAGKKWRVGIDRPAENNNTPGADLEAIISITNEALATSGNYRKFYVENGIKYSHTIDPRTGYPAKNNLLSATILASDCATADGIATACMVMGKENSISFIEAHPEFSAFFVYSDEEGNFRTWFSGSVAERISDVADN